MVAPVMSTTARNADDFGKQNPLDGGAAAAMRVLQAVVHDNATAGFQSLFLGTGVSTLKEVRQICNDEGRSKVDMIPDTYLPFL
ncbi:GL23485 [Drosophila persimilis]|uniref:GL23485 n=1 Tax=Drosophila persimilis TaxID=7234 RepID=B4IRU1_DROPE|nr:GL23485 [Drosophila persimilis]